MSQLFDSPRPRLDGRVDAAAAGGDVRGREGARDPAGRLGHDGGAGERGRPPPRGRAAGHGAAGARVLLSLNYFMHTFVVEFMNDIILFETKFEKAKK